MDNLFKLIALILLVFSPNLLADTYAAISDYRNPDGSYSVDQGAACTHKNPAPPNLNYYVPRPGNLLACDYYSSPGGVKYSDTFMIALTKSLHCPNGGTLSGSSCIAVAPCDSGSTRQPSGECMVTSCPAGRVLNTITHVCVTEVNCVAPERDNGFGICSVRECTGGQVLNGTSGVCQTPPVCGSTETYDNASNTCKLQKLNCPMYSHPSTANDKCLPDPPMGCPAGQHDDGSYNCVADAASACNANQVKGYIFGIPQCINKTNTDEPAKIAADAAAAKAAATSQAATAKAAADVAAANLAADPTNITKQLANTDAQANNTAKQAAATQAATVATEKGNAADSAALQSIAQSTKTLSDYADEDRKGFGTIPVPETIASTSFTAGSIPSGSSSGTCPAPYTINTSHGSIAMSYQAECDFAVKISPIVLTLAYLSAGLIVLGAIKE